MRWQVIGIIFSNTYSNRLSPTIRFKKEAPSCPKHTRQWEEFSSSFEQFTDMVMHLRCDFSQHLDHGVESFEFQPIPKEKDYYGQQL